MFDITKNVFPPYFILLIHMFNHIYDISLNVDILIFICPIHVSNNALCLPSAPVLSVFIYIILALSIICVHHKFDLTGVSATNAIPGYKQG